jgi:hypothetical protein
LFSTIMEDVSKEDLTQKTRLEEFMEKNVPKIVRDVYSTLWIGQDSKLFKAMMMAVQYSDFVARANRYHVLLDQGVPKNVALKTILDEHVNYGIDLGSVFEWLEKMGLQRFMKYTVGSNKMMIQKVKEDPLAIMSMHLLDIPTPADASVLMKDFGYTYMNPVESIWDMTGRQVIPPSTLEIMGIIK